MESSPPSKVRRIPSKIDRDIPDVARENADKFALGLAELIMKTPKYSFSGERLVILYEVRR